jgi:hypothetical protein
MARTLLALSGVVLVANACTLPPTDTQRRNGGAAPNPNGLISGDVLYVGPRPQCRWTDEATPRPVTIAGNVILLLFAYNNPPPPDGSATTATRLYTMNGTDMFELSDCMPLSPTPDEASEVIMRSASYLWPNIDLSSAPRSSDGSLPTADYQIRGFFDNDGDFNPFFSVRNLGTAGDVGGGALVDATAAIPQFRRIVFHNVADPAYYNGERNDGVAVTLGAVINTERPMFTVADTTQALSSEATIPLVADSIMQEQALFDLTRMHLSLVSGNDQLDGTQTWGAALNAAGIQFDFSPRVYGLAVNTVPDARGFPQPHPILGSNGVSWYTPIILMQRAKNPIETLAGLPDVLLIGSVRPTVVAGVSQGFVPRETLNGADVLVPPVAVLVTNPADPILCRVPVIAPGNAAEIYEQQRSECQELPTGNYDVNVLAGVAGGRTIDVYASCLATCTAGGTPEATCMASCDAQAALRTDTGYVFEGGNYSNQAWSIPNELGCPDTAYHPATSINQIDPRDAHGHFPECGSPETLQLTHQGRQGGFAVVDPSDANEAMIDPTSTTDGRGIAACTSALHTSGSMAGMVGPIDRSHQAHIPSQCCAPIMHLCGLPLCPLRDASTDATYPEAVRAAGGSRMTREMRVPNVDYRMNADGTVTPLCLPFLMPTDCCAQPMM